MAPKKIPIQKKEQLRISNNNNNSKGKNIYTKNGVVVSPQNFYLPPDPYIASANGYAMLVWNLQYQIYAINPDKTIGTPTTSPQDYSTIFGGIVVDGVRFSRLSISDPMVVFTGLNDGIGLGSGRFVLILFYTTSKTAGILLAVSKSNIPTVGSTNWYSYWFRSYGSTNVYVFPDYPKIGYNNYSLYVSINAFGFPRGGYLYPVIYRIPNSLLTSANDKKQLTVTRVIPPNNTISPIPGIPGNPQLFSVFPLQIYDNIPDMYFVSALPYSTENRIIVHKSIGGFLNNIVTTIIPVNQYNFPINPSQPGTSITLDSLGNRISTGVMGNSTIWTAHTIIDGSGYILDSSGVSSTSLDKVRWYGIDVSSTPTLKGSGNIQYYDNVNVANTFMSAINVNSLGNVLLTFNSSGSSVYPNVGYFSFPASTATTFTSNQVGSTNNLYNPRKSYTYSGNPTRWGDYAAVSLYPNDKQTFYSSNEITNSTSTTNWSIYMGSITDTSGIISPLGLTSLFNEQVEPSNSIVPLNNLNNLDNTNNLNNLNNLDNLIIPMSNSVVNNQNSLINNQIPEKQNYQGYHINYATNTPKKNKSNKSNKSNKNENALINLIKKIKKFNK